MIWILLSIIILAIVYVLCVERPQAEANSKRDILDGVAHLIRSLEVENNLSDQERMELRKFIIEKVFKK